MSSSRRGGLATRGSSLIEVLVVTVLIASLTTASLVWFSSASRPDAESAARSSLLVVAELERAAFAEGDPALGPTELSELDSSQTYVGGPSTSPGVVSVVVSGTSVLAASLSDGGSCWMLRLELVPSPLAPPTLWWVGPTPSSKLPECAAAAIQTLPDEHLPPPGSSAGSRSDSPIAVA